MTERPPWERLATLLGDIDERAERIPPDLRARIDQVDAEVRDFFDDRGLTVADEWTAYTSLVTCDLLAGQSLNAYRHGLLSLGAMQTNYSLLIGNAALFATPARVRS